MSISAMEALSLIRSLDGSPGYPFHEEGEARMAAILAASVANGKHAHAVIEEFDNGFPTAEQVKAAARRMGEKCQCGFSRYEHAENGCKSFVAVDQDDFFTNTKRDTSKEWRQFKNSVPLVDGVRWEVCLQVETIRIDLGMRGTPPDPQRIAADERDFPEAVAAIRAGREPNYKQIDSILAARIPGYQSQQKPNRMRQLPERTPFTQADIDREIERRKQNT